MIIYILLHVVVRTIVLLDFFFSGGGDQTADTSLQSSLFVFSVLATNSGVLILAIMHRVNGQQFLLE